MSGIRNIYGWWWFVIVIYVERIWSSFHYRNGELSVGREREKLQCQLWYNWIIMHSWFVYVKFVFQPATVRFRWILCLLLISTEHVQSNFSKINSTQENEILKILVYTQISGALYLFKLYTHKMYICISVLNNRLLPEFPSVHVHWILTNWRSAIPAVSC